MLDRRGSLGLSEEARLGLRVLGQVGSQQFQGDAALEFGVLGFVDNAHAALAEFFEQSVVGNGALGGGAFGTTRFLAPDGATEVASSAFVLVNGGREGWFVDTTGPFVLRATFKRIDPVDERHDQKVDALADDLALTKERGRRMAAVLGVLRRNE